MLITTIKKEKEWIRFNLPNGQKIKVLVKDHDSGNNLLATTVIDCPREIKIDRTQDENFGNK